MVPWVDLQCVIVVFSYTLTFYHIVLTIADHTIE